MSPIHTRPARESDIPQILKLFKDSLVQSYGGFINMTRDNPWLHGTAADEYVTRTLCDMTVAEDVQGTVVAFGVLQGNFIDILWVRLERRGEGLGTQMMDEFEARIAEEHETARLECFEPNTPAIEFYRRRGYTIERTYFVEDAGVNTAVMVKKLDR
ncbi:MAG: GNAT family N-acetyltransferase [Planctomycetota bacterium]|nr:GNAT family N-acetyltransferase [Planctomycetota bacterium]